MSGGKFRTVGYIGGLPGDGWDGTPEKRIPGTGHMEGDVCIVKADNVDSKGRGEIKDSNLTLYTADNVKIAEFPKVHRKSTTVVASSRQIRVFLSHGEQDPQSPVSVSERAADHLLELGYRVEFSRFRGGHGVPYAQLDLVVQWLRDANQ